ncbi:MAG: PHP-associated domain-containing protein [Candidatus Woesearchaeota archaeon]
MASTLKKSSLKKYDLHIHSYYSNCSRNDPKKILEYAKKAGLNGIAITDHHTMRAYPILKKLNKDKNFEIIPGEEIRTQYGDVIALYIQKEVQSRDFFQVIKEIKAQGGLVIIPHPFRPVPWLKFKYSFNKIKGKIDAVETFNSRNTVSANVDAVKIAKKLGLAQVGSSDAHTLFDIGKGYTLFKGDLRKAIKGRTTTVYGTTKFGMISAMISSVNSRILTPLIGNR